MNRPLDQPEDRVFGLEEDHGDLSDVPRFGKAQTIAAALVKKVEQLRSKIPGQDPDALDESELAELAELQEQQYGADLRVGGPDSFGQHVEFLPQSRDYEQFLLAEQQATLFEQVEREHTRALRLHATGMWVSGLLWALVALLAGIPYTSALLQNTPAAPEWLSTLLDQAGQQHAAAAVVFAAAMLTPLICFLITANVVTDTLIAVLRWSLGHALRAGAGMLGILFSLSMVSSNPIKSVVVALGVLGGLKLFDRIIDVWGPRR